MLLDAKCMRPYLSTYSYIDIHITTQNDYAVVGASHLQASTATVSMRIKGYAYLYIRTLHV